jgi:hypothetical protein
MTENPEYNGFYQEDWQFSSSLKKLQFGEKVHISLKKSIWDTSSAMVLLPPYWGYSHITSLLGGRPN